jgi:tRNA threonylcarbamoyladenosine biosynthesis protein TsaE
MFHLFASSLADTQAIAAAVAGVLRTGDVVVLAGEMGAGKTAFAQGVAAALDVAGPVTSPTFTLVHSYEARVAGRRATLHHADLYRLDRTGEVADLALAELLEDEGVLLVEWGDVVATSFGDHLAVHLASTDHDDERRIDVRGVGQRWAVRWERLEHVLSPWVLSDGGRC